jgi:anthraniloyl-CoA monooxygenase
MWTLHAAAEQEYDGRGAEWPLPWQAGRRRPPTARTDKIPPRLSMLRDEGGASVHVRWRPNRANVGGNSEYPDRVVTPA